MHIPRYWAHSEDRSSGRGSPPTTLRCWHWSDVSIDDARRQAEERGTRLATRLRSGDALDVYPYGDQPLREQIVQSFHAGDDCTAIITRNMYGALVLNAARMMFIDIDFAGAPPSPAVGWLGRLFRKAPTVDPQPETLSKLRAWAQNWPQLGMRVYRTCAGLRCMITSHLFEPADPESIAMLQSAGSDPLYVRLCQAQRCFRARLTPKPWRCRIVTNPPRYPWTSAQDESLFRKWEAAYERATGPYSVCRLLDEIGPRDTHPEIAPLVALHDRYTYGDASRPLA